MLSDKNAPNIFRTHARFSPLEEIDWRARYNLGKSFRKQLESGKTKIEVSLAEKLWLRAKDLDCIFIEVALIISRINENGAKVNRREELFEITHDRMWTDEEEKEIENLGIAVNYLILDVKTLFININIFMDVLAKFLNLCIKSEKKPPNKNFLRFKSHLENYRGREIDELKKIIYENTKWFDDIKELRDDFVIHHPASRHALEFLNGEANIPLTTTKKGEYSQKHIIDGVIAKNISIKKIDSVLLQLKELLKELNEYLSKRVNKLPFKTKYVA